MSGDRCSACRTAKRIFDEEDEAASQCARCEGECALYKFGQQMLCALCRAAAVFAQNGTLTEKIRPSRDEYLRGVTFACSCHAVDVFIMVRIKKKNFRGPWCVFLLFRYVLFRRFGIRAALLVPAVAVPARHAPDCP